MAGERRQAHLGESEGENAAWSGVKRAARRLLCRRHGMVAGADGGGGLQKTKADIDDEHE